MFLPGDLLKVKGKTSCQASSVGDILCFFNVTYNDGVFLCLGRQDTRTYIRRDPKGLPIEVQFRYVLVHVKGYQTWLREDLLELVLRFHQNDP